ncbi:MAG: TetR family transcriptional regulator [Deltaproteobacteria bacterium]|nr:MAG: TetR family transcriptional regulator [Deltaproteobacteria bacterium]
MARRTAEEVAALREEIVDEALRQFADRGIDATAVSDIAKAVGISKQALMHHFRTKDALVEPIRERVKASLDDLLPHMVAAFTADESALDAILEELVSAMAVHFDLARFMLRVVAFGPSPNLPPAGDSIAALLLEYLRRGQAEGTLRDDFVPEDALFVIGMMFLASHAGSRHQGELVADVPERTLQVRRQRELVRVAKAALLAPVRE